MNKLDINGKIKQWEESKTRDKKGVKGLSKNNSDLTISFLKDFELGFNVPVGRRGRRTPSTLLKLRCIPIFLNKHFPKKSFQEINQEELHDLLHKMYQGEILKPNGKTYNGIDEFAKNFKTFWGWMIKTKRTTKDITKDLAIGDYKKTKPAWVYLTHEQIKTLIDQARGDYRALILFLYDSGLRPQESYRIFVEDFNKDFTELNIPKIRENGDKVSKTFERTIKLKQCSGLLKAYVKTNNLAPSDLLIQIHQPAFNKYLRTLSKKLFGEGKTKARGRYNQLKLYDIRHLASIFWLDRYKTNKDLMYRMGWTKEDKIYYYSEFLGRRDKIDDEDMITNEDVSKYKKENNELKTQIEIIFKEQERQKTFLDGGFLRLIQSMKNVQDFSKLDIDAMKKDFENEGIELEKEIKQIQRPILT